MKCKLKDENLDSYCEIKHDKNYPYLRKNGFIDHCNRDVYKNYEFCFACIEEIRFYLELCFTSKSHIICKKDNHCSCKENIKRKNDDLCTMLIVNEMYDYVLQNKMYDVNFLHESICKNVALLIAKEYDIKSCNNVELKKNIMKCICDMDMIILKGCQCGVFNANKTI